QRVGTTYLLDEADVERIGQCDVIDSIDQLSSQTQELLNKTGLMVFRLGPEKPRAQDPSDIMGFHLNTLAAGSRQGYIRYWWIGDTSWGRIAQNITDFGGQPVIYTVKGLCVDQAKITDGFRPAHNPRQWQLELSDTGDWAQDFVNTHVVTRPGGLWEWWVEPDNR